MGAHSFLASLRHAIPVVCAVFLACAVLSLVLPDTAIEEEYGEPIAA